MLVSRDIADSVETQAVIVLSERYSLGPVMCGYEVPMSSDTLTPHDQNPPRDVSTSFGPFLRPVVGVIQFVAFWLAVALPLIYLPMIALGLATTYPLGFVGLIGTNAIALAIGHGHDRPT